MKNKISMILLWIGVILAITCPAYQLIDMRLKNEEGDGVLVYGDNLFRNILGIKTVDHYFEPSSGWEETGGMTIQTPPWMQKCGLPKEVSSYSYNERPSDKNLGTVLWLRAGIKFIPFIFIIIGCFLFKKDRLD